MHNNTRRRVLPNVDGVAFIADSQLSEAKANNESFANLHQNLRDNGLMPESVPLVIQFNKRDLPPETIRSDEELEALAAEIGAALKARGEKIAVAESSSGGLISAALLSVPIKHPIKPPPSFCAMPPSLAPSY